MGGRTALACLLALLLTSSATRAEVISLGCEPRHVPGIVNLYEEPIRLRIDTDRKFVEMTLAGGGTKSTAEGIYPTPRGDVIGPLQVTITPTRIEWGAPAGASRAALAEFDGTVDRETGTALVRWYDRRNPIVGSQFRGTCRLVAPKF